MIWYDMLGWLELGNDFNKFIQIMYVLWIIWLRTFNLDLHSCYDREISECWTWKEKAIACKIKLVSVFLFSIIGCTDPNSDIYQTKQLYNYFLTYVWKLQIRDVFENRTCILHFQYAVLLLFTWPIYRLIQALI